MSIFQLIWQTGIRVKNHGSISRCGWNMLTSFYWITDDRVYRSNFLVDRREVVDKQSNPWWNNRDYLLKRTWRYHSSRGVWILEHVHAHKKDALFTKNRSQYTILDHAVHLKQIIFNQKLYFAGRTRGRTKTKITGLVYPIRFARNSPACPDVLGMFLFVTVFPFAFDFGFRSLGFPWLYT